MDTGYLRIVYLFCDNNIGLIVDMYSIVLSEFDFVT